MTSSLTVDFCNCAPSHTRRTNDLACTYPRLIATSRPTAMIALRTHGPRIVAGDSLRRPVAAANRSAKTGRLTAASARRKGKIRNTKRKGGNDQTETTPRYTHG